MSADTLAGSRFAVSPLAETVAALKLLERAAAAHPGERAWLDAHLPGYRARLEDDPVTALLVRAALRPAWNATFLTPVPEGGRPFEEELARIAGTSPAAARDDLAEALGGPLPAVLGRDDLPGRAAGLLHWVWAETVLPSWPARRRIIEADIVARTALLGRDGWQGALGGMRDGMRWLGGGRLQITADDHPPRALRGARLAFVPVTPRQSWLCWEGDRHAVVYPCSAALADAGRRRAPEPLRALLGPARAAVLVLLDAPKSTTQLVALTGQGLGSVGRHLRVLLDARLVQRRRTGRSVLYSRTPAGDALVAAQPSG